MNELPDISTIQEDRKTMTVAEIAKKYHVNGQELYNMIQRFDSARQTGSYKEWAEVTELIRTGISRKQRLKNEEMLKKLKRVKIIPVEQIPRGFIW